MAVGAAHDERKEYLVEDYGGFDVGPLRIALRRNLAPLVVGERGSGEPGAMERPIRWKGVVCLSGIQWAYFLPQGVGIGRAFRIVFELWFVCGLSLPCLLPACAAPDNLHRMILVTDPQRQ